MRDSLVRIENLFKSFPSSQGMFGSSRGSVKAIRGVSLEIGRGETLGLVGESGCGKSTLGFAVLRLIDPDSGKIFFDGADITKLDQRHLRPLRRQMQIIFQDPFASLNPRMTVGSIIEEPMLVHKVGTQKQRSDRVRELIKLVGLSEDSYSKYPHEFSGGQRQRIGIARAIALTPRLIVADEPVSALDISIRGEILNLLSDLREKFSLSFLFISHDLKAVELMSRRVAVMYLGRLMELFPASRLADARHPYTQALISAIPVPDPKTKHSRIVLSGDVPSPLNPPEGCPFHPRCPYAKALCREEEPQFEEYAEGLFAACHFIKEMKSAGQEVKR